MANMCSNILYISLPEGSIGTEEDIFIAAKDLIENLDAVLDKDQELELEADEFRLEYETKWSPHLPELQVFIDKYPKLDFKLWYEELGACFYGEMYFSEGKTVKDLCCHSSIIGIENPDDKIEIEKILNKYPEILEDTVFIKTKEGYVSGGGFDGESELFDWLLKNHSLGTEFIYCSGISDSPEIPWCSGYIGSYSNDGVQ